MTLVNTALHSHSIYGARVTSDIPLSFQAAAKELRDQPVADVAFVQGDDRDFAAFVHPAHDEFVFEEGGDGTVYLRWPGLFEFVVSPDGLRVARRALDGCDVSVFQHYLFGQVLGVALVRQGIEPWHAAAMQIDDVAVGLLGDCAFGKSTLLASFARAGHRVLTDDMLIVRRDWGGMYALPGSGRIKLLPDSARRFLDDADGGVQLTPSTTKQSFALDPSKVQRTPLPLRQLFVLPEPPARDRSTSIDVQPVSPADVVCSLLKNTFTTHLVDRRRLARQFDCAWQLASAVDGFLLHYPSGLRFVDDVRETIVRHVREAGAGRASS